jgi:hypothetical protein
LKLPTRSARSNGIGVRTRTVQNGISKYDVLSITEAPSEEVMASADGSHGEIPGRRPGTRHRKKPILRPDHTLQISGRRLTGLLARRARTERFHGGAVFPTRGYISVAVGHILLNSLRITPSHSAWFPPGTTDRHFRHAPRFGNLRSR